MNCMEECIVSNFPLIKGKGMHRYMVIQHKTGLALLTSFGLQTHLKFSSCAIL